MSATPSGPAPASPRASRDRGSGPRYRAFLSYSHADGPAALDLHRRLETYVLPRRLVGRVTSRGPVPRRVYPVFRDRDELAGSADLGAAIRTALEASESLVVLCSPHAAASRYVALEVRAFRDLGRGDRILCVVLSGEPGASRRPGSGRPECLPAPLLEEPHGEPLAVDLRTQADGRHAGLLKLVAGLTGLPVDELVQRDARRRRRRRRWLAGAGAALVLVLAAVYVLLADRGAALPGAAAIRDALDARDLSLARPAPAPDALRRAAEGLLPAFVDRLREDGSSRGWVRTGRRAAADDRGRVSVWVTSQALTGLLHGWRAGQREEAVLQLLLEAPFEPGFAVEREGRLYGWGPGSGAFTQAEPALWTAAALALALRHPGLLSPAQAERATERLRYVHRVLATYHPLPQGGWNLFPDQVEPGAHSTYTTTLALLALLETRLAALDWADAQVTCDDLVACTARWLIDQHDAAGPAPGWRTEEGATGPIADGLTLQTYAELLRAEAVAGVALPDALVAGARRHVAALAERPYEFPRATASLARRFTNYDGATREERQTIELAWQPWAIACAQRLLARELRTGAATLHAVRARRALGRLLIDQAEALRATARSRATETFVVSELLYALAEVAES